MNEFLTYALWVLTGLIVIGLFLWATYPTIKKPLVNPHGDAAFARALPWDETQPASQFGLVNKTVDASPWPEAALPVLDDVLATPVCTPDSPTLREDLKELGDAAMTAAIDLAQPFPEQPPADNAHVLPGCELFASDANPFPETMDAQPFPEGQMPVEVPNVQPLAATIGALALARGLAEANNRIATMTRELEELRAVKEFMKEWPKVQADIAAHSATQLVRPEADGYQGSYVHLRDEYTRAAKDRDRYSVAVDEIAEFLASTFAALTVGYPAFKWTYVEAGVTMRYVGIELPTGLVTMEYDDEDMPRFSHVQRRKGGDPVDAATTLKRLRKYAKEYR